METIKALIDKLYHQSGQQADVNTLLFTVQQLQRELMRHTAGPASHTGSAKVAVVLPAGQYNYPVKEATPEAVSPWQSPALRADLHGAVNTPAVAPAIDTFPLKEKQPGEPAVTPLEESAGPWVPANIPNAKPPVEAAWQPAMDATPARPAQADAAAGNPALPVLPQPGSRTYDPVQEIPTLSLQKAFKEMNDVFGQYETSLNDTLRSEKTELAAVLKEGPIKDLKKGIGINDRFVFLSELFRDDEAMYERSIKTINNFRIYPEAEYWIERELKVKLGWDESKATVKHFRQLVRRRFM